MPELFFGFATCQDTYTLIFDRAHDERSRCHDNDVSAFPSENEALFARAETDIAHQGSLGQHTMHVFRFQTVVRRERNIEVNRYAKQEGRSYSVPSLCKRASVTIPGSVMRLMAVRSTILSFVRQCTFLLCPRHISH